MIESKMHTIATPEFIEEWLHHFAILYEKEIAVPNMAIKMDYLLPHYSKGIFISRWKRPISVQLVNKLMSALDILGLNEIFIVAKKISEHAKDTLERLNIPITTVHPHGLSEIAMKLVNLSKLQDLYAPTEI
ncbi:MAG: hypothetical protein ACXAD7_00680 [Candidatus Kariarchaeaceae archaeon]|jgi:hypothetical protein